METSKIAHLGFIQGVINRMGTNSFQIKGWSVALIVASFALSAKDSNHSFMVYVYYPILVFWVLDSYFLHQEKLFRKLYEGVANNRIKSEKYTLNTSLVKDSKWGIFSILFSPTIFVFYGALILLTFIGINTFFK